MWSAIWVGLYKGRPKCLSEVDLGLSEICPPSRTATTHAAQADMSMAQ